jgi:GTPase SAR1 family protein
MTTTLSNSTPATRLTPNMLRIVLFGMPNAGKSSLLGALAQSAQSQEGDLEFRLTDRSDMLGELQRRVYEDDPRQTQAETVFYPVSYEPFRDAKPDASRRGDAVLIDCDGRVAAEIMANRPLGSSDGSLSTEIRAADAIVFVVDSSASAAQVDRDLTEAVRFLARFQRERSSRSDVGGLPVMLVLSKCDLLAEPNDSRAAWQSRIEQKKKDIGQRFREFIIDAGDLDFGKIDLRVVATAVKMPALKGEPPRELEPWGIAPLFHDALIAAGAFRRRRGISRTMMAWTFLAALALVAMLAVIAVTLYANRKSLAVLALSSRVESYRIREGPTAATRLAEPLQKKAAELDDISSDPEFVNLPVETQRFVQDRITEIAAYRQFKDRLRQLRRPTDAASNEDLRELHGQLTEELKPPEKFAADWRGADADQLRSKWLADIAAMQAASATITDSYRQLAARANALVAALDSPAPDWTKWSNETAALFREAEAMQFSPETAFRDSVALPGAPAATHRSVLSFPTVVQARESWTSAKATLELMNDLAVATGLINESHRPPALKLASSFAVGDAAAVLAEMRKSYPRLLEASGEAPAAIRSALQSTWNSVAAAGRSEFANRSKSVAGSGSMTVQAMQTAASQFTSVEDLRVWRELTTLLSRWLPSIGDPIASLTSFLNRQQFDIDLRGLRLTIPDELKDKRLRPNGQLVISAQRADRSVATQSFRLADEGVRDPNRRATTFTFVSEGNGQLTIHPGDIVWAEVDLRDTAGQTWKLSWWANGIRNKLYQFDRLTLPPQVHRLDQKAEEGTPAMGVSLSFVPERAWPKSPDLLPDFR